MSYNIYMVGVGGQGVLTIGDILAEAACRSNIPVNFYPTKGMAQRGGSVKAQIRLGHEVVGPNIPTKSANLVIAMEVSEALKAVRFVRSEGEVLLYGWIWQPTAVVLGKECYPTLDQVQKHLKDVGARVNYINPEDLPLFKDSPIPGNIFTLGVAIGNTRLGSFLDSTVVASVVNDRWGGEGDRNNFALHSGLCSEHENEH